MGQRFCINFVAPEMVTAKQMCEDCQCLDELEGHTRNVVAADAWAVGALIFYVATGSVLVLEDPEDTNEEEDYEEARLPYLQQVHAGWKVSALGTEYRRVGMSCAASSCSTFLSVSTMYSRSLTLCQRSALCCCASPLLASAVLSLAKQECRCML